MVNVLFWFSWKFFEYFFFNCVTVWFPQIISKYLPNNVQGILLFVLAFSFSLLYSVSMIYYGTFNFVFVFYGN